ncbi:MAG: lysophospholipid acyltransferase family protein [Sphingomonadaceae bacterium]
MTGAQHVAQRSIPLFGWLPIILRSLAIILLLLVSLLLYGAFHPFTYHNPAPRFFLGNVARIVGVRFRQTGKLEEGGVFLLANHVSWIDILVLAGLTGTAFIAQDGLAKLPWLHWLCRLNDTVFIARDRRQTIATQVEQVREALRDTGALTIFPEGTTADGVDLLPFKSSLLSALEPVPEGIAIQPAWLDYGAEAREVSWVGDEPGLDNYLRIAARLRPIEVTVHFLSPLNGETLSGRKPMAAAAYTAISEAKAAR